ncbi:MAG: hypothetical protein KAU14_07280 [Thermoplasmata archaeon]|nr:hypothetical protein [Thermoplasmata archaeon]
MDFETFIGTAIGFTLAIAFLTHLLIKYEDFLDDRKLYIGSGFGFICAIIAYLVEQMGVFSFHVEDVAKDSSLAFISIFGIAILHTAMKGLSLNHRMLREGKDWNIAFYGTSFGFIFGAVYVTVLISKSLKSGDLEGEFDHILLFLLALGMILFQGSTSVIMGWGIPQGKLFLFFRNIVLVHIFMNVFIFLSAVNLIPPFLMVSLVLAYGILLYTYAYRVVLPASLTKDQRKKLFSMGRPIGKRLSRLPASKTSKDKG